MALAGGCLRASCWIRVDIWTHDPSSFATVEGVTEVHEFYQGCVSSFRGGWHAASAPRGSFKGGDHCKMRDGCYPELFLFLSWRDGACVTTIGTGFTGSVRLSQNDRRRWGTTGILKNTLKYILLRAPWRAFSTNSLRISLRDPFEWWNELL